MKSVLLLTDFSDTARNAALYALKLFEKQEVQFTLLNAFDIEFSGTPYVVQIKEELEAESRKKLEEDRFYLLKRVSGAQLHSASRFGPLLEVLHQEISKNQVDCVVMGCRGESAIENFLLGSNTYEVIKHVHIPLLVIPGHVSYRRPEKMTFATDMRSMDKPEMMAPLRKLALNQGAQILFVNVLGQEYVNRLEAEQQLSKHLQGVQISFHFVEGEDIRKSILEFMEEHNSHFAILVRHDLKFIDRMFNPSLTKKMVLKPQYPMLILRNT